MDGSRTFNWNFILRLLYLLFHVNPSFAYSLKGCTILYQDNLSAGVSVDCANRELVAVPDDIPKEAVSIELRGNMFQRLQNDFRGMSRLIYLGLRKSGITHVDDGCFTDLVSLKTLIMRNNELRTLTTNMFQGLSNITMLDLSYNGIDVIHDSAFEFLTSLQILDLDFNNLRSIAYLETFLKLPQITTLNLRCNDFSFFESKQFMLNESSTLEQLTISGDYLRRFSITTPIFPYLQMIELSSCGLPRTLEWDISDKMLVENITQLYVEENVLSFKGMQNVLHNLISLKHLRINMELSWIRKGLLSTACKVQSLRRLDLFYNKLYNLTFKLAPCSQLTELYLQETNIDELTKGSIQSMKMLQVLNASDNKLTEVSYDIRRLAFLKILHLDNNCITKLTCEDFENTTRLIELNLNSNQIADLDRCVLEHFTDLKNLDLSYNQLKSFGDMFKVSLHKLKLLDISENNFDVISENTFEGLKSLRHLKMASDNILLVNKRFPKLSNLVDLNLSFAMGYEPDFQGFQRLENITVWFGKGFSLKKTNISKHGTFRNVKFLKTLTIISTQYFNFPYNHTLRMLRTMRGLETFKAVKIFEHAPDLDTFRFNPRLKSLIFTGSDMSDLKPELFRTISELQKLDLSDSLLTSVNFLAQANLSALKYLKIANNRILLINDAVLKALPSLTYLDASNNLFTCDCSNAGFIQWVKNNKQTQVVNAHKYLCSFPLSKQGTLLLDFNTQYCWVDLNFSCFVSSISLVFLTLLSSFIHHFLWQYLVYSFQLFLAFLYDTRKRKTGNQFDAFVSYNVHDENWVYNEMLPALEEEQGWKLCLHHRDFQPGKPIIENIADAIYGSRKTICVISRHYLQSEWCSNEIKMASFRLFSEKKDVLILLFLEEIPSRYLSPYVRMRKLVKKRSFLSWPKMAKHPEIFWQNVERALQAGDVLPEIGPTLL